MGRKIGMTRIIADDGSVIPVSVVECTPNEIVYVKTSEKDGYPALVLGFDAYHRPTKTKKFKHVGEFRFDIDGKTKGDVITVALFDGVTEVKVTGHAKGRGFAGVIKRHNFRRGPETHGSHHHRQPGSSSGGRTGTGRVKKGKRFPGHMGTQQVSTRMEIVRIDTEKNLIIVKGPVPGAPNDLVKISA